MDRRFFLSLITGSSFVFAAWNGLSLAETPRSDASAGHKLKWQKNLKTAHKLSVEQDKPIMIVFGADWCTFCHKLERETLNDNKTMALIDRNFIALHLDFEKDAKIAKILEVDRLPCTVILTPDADLLVKSEGFAEAKKFQSILNSALEKRAEIQQVRSAESRD